MSPSPRTRLEDALRHHLAGDHEQARVALVDLLNDDRVTDREIRIRARVYLGEVLFVEGNRDASWDAFAALLEDDPRYRLDPYEHPPDVMAFFETVRAARAEGRATLPAAGVPARVPLLAYAPFGAWQIANQEPWTGWTLATVQVASGVASLWLLADLTESHETRDPEVYDTMRLKRRLSWTATAVFYGAWLVGGIDAWSAARGTQPSRAAVQVVPLPDGLSVALAVRTP
ncbi:MAG: hypothetical protein JXB39_16875 [Deltaproteobacteria bacterium]|nr:hypothetical protein [Deltaproteobacteria bacterium]